MSNIIYLILISSILAILSFIVQYQGKKRKVVSDFRPLYGGGQVFESTNPNTFRLLIRIYQFLVVFFILIAIILFILKVYIG
jgi:hypothetical protein